jgi:hypothetical protein
MPTAQDTYFKNEEGVLAVYDFDYEAASDFGYKLGLRTSLCMAASIPYCWPFFPFVACFLYSPMFYDNIKEVTEAQHVAITRDGIKYVTERHKSGCRCDCQDVGKQSKTVPFDKITDCDIREPAGSSGPCCCMVENVLHEVNVDTASGNRTAGNAYELVLKGLKDPDQFKRDVWSMKRGEGISGISASAGLMAAPVELQMDRLDTSAAAYKVQSSSGVSSQTEGQLVDLMRENNQLLKTQNKILTDILAK